MPTSRRSEIPRAALRFARNNAAAATIGRDHDKADRENGRRIACPLFSLWSARGGIDSWDADEGEPLAMWRAWAGDVEGRATGAGHSFPEEHTEETAEARAAFFRSA